MTLKSNLPEYITCSTPELAYAVAHMIGRGRSFTPLIDHFLEKTCTLQLHIYSDLITIWSSDPKHFKPGYPSVSTLAEARELLFDQPFKIGGHTVEFREDAVQVGCTLVTKEDVKAVYARLYPKEAGYPSPVVHSPHNPDNLTQKQLQPELGYRFLDKDEVKETNKSLREIEAWGREEWDAKGYYGASSGLTYRTKLTREQLAAARAQKG